MSLLLCGLSLPEPTQLNVASSRVTEHASCLTNIVNSAFRSWCPFISGKHRVQVGPLTYLAVPPKMLCGIARCTDSTQQKATVQREFAKALDDPQCAMQEEAVNARSVPFALHILIKWALLQWVKI